MKKIFAIVLLAFMLCFSLCACGNHVSKEEKEEIIKIASNVIDTNINKGKAEKDTDKFSMWHDISDETYEIVNITETDNSYVVTIEFKATSTYEFAQYTPIYYFSDLLTTCSYNGKDITCYETKNGERYNTTSLWINGVKINEKKGGSSESKTSSKCTICGQKATNTFQGSGYCSKHYSDAVKWAINNVAEKD